jgi:hypothetical protein
MMIPTHLMPDPAKFPNPEAMQQNVPTRKRPSETVIIHPPTVPNHLMQQEAQPDWAASNSRD